MPPPDSVQVQEPRNSQLPPQPQQPFGDFVRSWWGPFTGVAGIIAMLAVGNSTLNTVSQTQQAMLADQRELARRFDEHVRSPWHQGADQRFLTIERRMSDMESDQKNMNREVRAQLEAINKNIVALCAAMRGALCSR